MFKLAKMAWMALKAHAGMKGRKGGVLVEYVVLVSIVALSAGIIAAVTGFASEVEDEYTEMGTAVDGL